MTNHETERLQDIQAKMLPKLDSSHKVISDKNECIIIRPQLERDFGVYPPFDILPENYLLHIDHILFLRENLREQYHHYHLYCFDLSLECAYMRHQMIKIEFMMKKGGEKIHLVLQVVLQNMVNRYLFLTKELQNYLHILKSYHYQFSDEYNFPTGHHIHERYYDIKAVFPLFLI